MKEMAFLNGQFMPLGEARISVNDRGFLFGDSIYEVMLTYGGRLWALERHLTRLGRSLDAIAIKGVDLQALRGNIIEAHRRSGIERALIYIQITRGAAPRSHVPDGPMEPTVLITVRPMRIPLEDAWREGVPAVLAPETRWSRRDIKSTNLLPNILAKRQAYERGAYDAIFFTEDGWLTEASSSNVFVVCSGVVRTPPHGPTLLPGITRDLVVETARREGIPLEELPVSREELLGADEVFLTGTVSEVIGVVRVDEQPIGSGSLGPITRRLHAAYRRRVAAEQDALDTPSPAPYNGP